MAGRGKNLLKNSSAQEGLEHWDILESGGDGFKVEDIPDGCLALNECANIKGEKGCWAVSHDPCVKQQVVDLIEAGISDEKLDNKKPPITVKEWYGCRRDCGCRYQISVRLLAEDKETVLDSWEHQDEKEEGSEWTKAKHVFENYPEGVRFVEFKHGGEDNKNWAGHYGVKLTRSGVFVGKKKSKKTKRALKDLKGKNLIQNPCAADEFEGWEVLSSEGDGMIVESEPRGISTLTDCGADLEADTGCWCTSNGLGQKRQLVDLLKASGLDRGYVDDVKPEIYISEWYGARSDAGCKYWLSVRLLNEDQEEMDKVEIERTEDATGKWRQVTHTFHGYGEGARYVEYTHGGHDTCYWAGHYGVKFTASTIMFRSGAATSTSSSSSSSSTSSDEEN